MCNVFGPKKISKPSSILAKINYSPANNGGRKKEENVYEVISV